MNSAACRWRLCGWSLLVAACAPAAAVEQPLQGVVEHDVRVIGFELAGRVTEVSVKRGDLVASGAPLAKLDDTLERPERALRAAELAAAEAELRLLEAGARNEDLRAAEAEIASLAAQAGSIEKQLTRQLTLFAAGASTEAVIDDLRAGLRSLEEKKRALEQRHRALRSGARFEEIAAARAHVEAMRASVEVVEARLARFALVSPVAGHVTDVHVDPGEMVLPGAPAITLADLDHPFVDVFVPQARMHEVELGGAARARVDGVSMALSAKVEHVFPRTEFTPRYLFSESERPSLVVRVRMRIDDPKHLLHDGVPAFVRLAPRSFGEQVSKSR